MSMFAYQIAHLMTPEQRAAANAAVVKRDMEVLDSLPTPLRNAIRFCDFYLLIPIKTRGIDVPGLVARIEALKSDADAIELNKILRQMR